MKKLLFFLILLSLALAVFLYGPKFIQKDGAKGSVGSLSDYERMDNLSQEVYSLTKEKKFPEAKIKLEEIGSLFASSKPPKGLTIESMDTITQTLVKAKQAYASVNIDPNQLLWHALQVRLTMDSLTHANQPIWKNYYKSYKDHINKMSLYVTGKKKDDFTRTFLQNIQLYQMLKPAISIRTSPQDMEKLLSMYRFLLQESRKADINWDQVQQVLVEMNKQVDKIFLGEEEMTYANAFSPGSPLFTVTLVGSFLLASLSYVAFRMYKANRST